MSKKSKQTLLNEIQGKLDSLMLQIQKEDDIETLENIAESSDVIFPLYTCKDERQDKQKLYFWSFTKDGLKEATVSTNNRELDRIQYVLSELLNTISGTVDKEGKVSF